MSDITITCSKCNKIFKRQKNFEKHQQICNGNQCEYCNEKFLDKYYLQKHIQICIDKCKHDIKVLEKNINSLQNDIKTKNNNISNLENQILNCKEELKENNKKYNNLYSRYDILFNDYESLKQKYEESQLLNNTLKDDLTNKDKEITELKVIEKMNKEYIEHLKDSKPTIIYNTNTTNNNSNQFANNINNATLIKSPEVIIENIDTKSLLQSNTFKNEEDFADYWHKKGLTKNIQVTDRSRFKTKHIDKNSNVIEDTNCSILADKIYTSTTESAKHFTKDLLDKFKDIHQDEDYGKRDKNRKVQELYDSKDLALNIISKNKKSLDKFGKLLVKYADYNIRKLIDQNKDKSKFITKLINIINNKSCGIFWNDFNHIGQQLQYYLKNDIVNFQTEKHILVKDDSNVNVKIDGEFLLTFLIEMLREKNKETFINDQLKILLGNKYDNYTNIYKMANFFFEEQTTESLSKAKQDIIFGLTT
jgi:hypothetical protein